jgi:hypothetical protein
MNMLFASKETSTRTDRTLDKRRAHIHAMWSAVAPAWAQHADYVDHTTAGITKALCREGLMFALDPAQAAREIHRVIRPDGRVALAASARRPTYKNANRPASRQPINAG